MAGRECPKPRSSLCLLQNLARLGIPARVTATLIRSGQENYRDMRKAKEAGLRAGLAADVMATVLALESAKCANFRRRLQSDKNQLFGLFAELRPPPPRAAPRTF